MVSVLVLEFFLFAGTSITLGWGLNLEFFLISRLIWLSDNFLPKTMQLLISKYLLLTRPLYFLLLHWYLHPNSERFHWYFFRPQLWKLFLSLSHLFQLLIFSLAIIDYSINAGDTCMLLCYPTCISYSSSNLVIILYMHHFSFSKKTKSL